MALGLSGGALLHEGGVHEATMEVIPAATAVTVPSEATLAEAQAKLAAMQAGFAFRPVVVRRGATQESARSVMGEFVSGNYFRTFGLQPRAGRLLADADDVQGAPTVAVMSYETWKNNYSGDSSVVGSTFFVNTQPVTIAGIAPEGFYGDRLSSQCRAYRSRRPRR